MPASNGPRNFMHISDAARLIIRAAEQRLEGTHAVTYQGEIDLYDFAISAFRVFGQGGGPVIDPSKTPFRSIAYPRNIEIFRHLGCQPEISPEKSLELIRDAGTADRFGPMDVQ